jgi:hypothetical protein
MASGKVFSSNDLMTVGHFLKGVVGLYVITVAGLGFLVSEAFAIHGKTSELSASLAGIEKRVGLLEEAGKEISSGLTGLQDKDLSGIRQQLSAHEQKLQCVACAPAMVVPVGALRPSYPR